MTLLEIERKILSVSSREAKRKEFILPMPTIEKRKIMDLTFEGKCILVGDGSENFRRQQKIEIIRKSPGKNLYGGGKFKPFQNDLTVEICQDIYQNVEIMSIEEIKDEVVGPIKLFSVLIHFGESLGNILNSLTMQNVFWTYFNNFLPTASPIKVFWSYIYDTFILQMESVENNSRLTLNTSFRRWQDGTVTLNFFSGKYPDNWDYPKNPLPLTFFSFASDLISNVTNEKLYVGINALEYSPDLVVMMNTNYICENYPINLFFNLL